MKKYNIDSIQDILKVVTPENKDALFWVGFFLGLKA